MVTLNTKRAKRQHKQSDNSSGDFWRPDEGRNTIRVFMFGHEVQQDDIDRGIYLPDEASPGDISGEFVYEGKVHFTNPPTNCAGRGHCDICDQWRKLVKELGSDSQRARQMRPVPRFYMNIVDTGSGSEEMAVYGAPTTVYDVICSTLFDPDYDPQEILGHDGRDFIIEYNPKADSPQGFYTVRLRDVSKSKKLPESLEDDAQDLFEVSALQPGWSTGDNESSDEDESEVKSKPEEESDNTEAANGEIKATRYARDLAEENGIDLSNVEGTGTDGKITKSDVEDVVNNSGGDDDGGSSSSKTKTRTRTRTRSSGKSIEEKAIEEPGILVGETIRFEAEDVGEIEGEVIEIDEGMFVVPHDDLEYLVEPTEGFEVVK